MLSVDQLKDLRDNTDPNELTRHGLETLCNQAIKAHALARKVKRLQERVLALETFICAASNWLVTPNLFQWRAVNADGADVDRIKRWTI